MTIVAKDKIDVKLNSETRNLAQTVNTAVALGDLDGDGDLDAVGVSGSSTELGTIQIWFNEHEYFQAPTESSLPTTSKTACESTHLTLGDLNQDQKLDLVVLNQALWGKGDGNFTVSPLATSSPISEVVTATESAFPITSTTSNHVILTDLNDDSYPDAILYQQFLNTSLDAQPVKLRILFGDNAGQFHDSGQTLEDEASLSGDKTEPTVVVGDFIGHQSIDIITRSGVWSNDGTGHFSQWWPEHFNQGRPKVAGDLDNDGDLDLYVLNESSQTISSTLFSSVWFNDGNGVFHENIQSRNETAAIDAVVGDLNRDGYIDIATLVCQPNVVSSTVTPTVQIYLNQMGKGRQSQLLLQPIDPTGSTNGISSSYIFTQPVIPITFTLSAPLGQGNGYIIRACYSLNGGNDWQMAIAQGKLRPPSDHIIQHDSLGPSELGCPYLDPIINTDSVFTVSPQVITNRFLWDTLASGFFGQSDNVHFRIEAIPDYHPVAHGVAGSYQWPLFATNSLSFRAHGVQVQVYNETLTSTLAGAAVYRLPQNQTPPATQIAPNSDSFPAHTNDKGLLTGRNEFAISDTLVALWPTKLISEHEPAHYYMRENVTPIINRFLASCRLVPPKLRWRYLEPEARSRQLDCSRRQRILITYDNTRLTIHSEAQQIGKISIWLSFTKTTEADLQLTLVAPDTRKILLASQPITELQGYTGHVDLLFDDTATVGKHITETGSSKSMFLTIRPAMPLKQLTGLLRDGEWELQIDNPNSFAAGSFDWGMKLYLSDLYYTSAKPTLTGLAMARVTTGGTQVLTVTKDNPLLLFPLDVALEWDASNDQRFLERLEKDLKHTSEYLYDWTNGQVALGQVHVYNDAKRPGHYPGDPWSMADVRIYATNRLRPYAAQGGIVDDVYRDPLVSTITYTSGQVYIGAVWNRFGDTLGNQDEDWPRTLAHELGHYLLFLDDNYLGEKDGLLVSVTGCTGAMADQYSEDNQRDYDEFHLEKDWNTPPCQATFSNRTHRWDWKTIKTFYPALIEPSSTFPGPTSLPIDVTKVDFLPSTPTSEPIPIRAFLLKDKEGHPLPVSAHARAFFSKVVKIS